MSPRPLALVALAAACCLPVAQAHNFLPPAANDSDVVVPQSREDITEFFIRTAPFKVLFEIFQDLPAPSAPLAGEYLAELLEYVLCV